MKFEWLQIVVGAGAKAELRAEGWVGYSRGRHFIAVRPVGVRAARPGWQNLSTRQALAELGVQLPDDMLVPIRPSDVKVLSPFDLVDMFGKSEAEQFAVFMIWTLAANGDVWRPVSFIEIADHLRTLVDPTNPPSWAINPFLRPLAPVLVQRGWAAWTGDEKTAGLEFTPAATSELTARFGNV